MTQVFTLRVVTLSPCKLILFSFTLEQGKKKSFQPVKSFKIGWQKCPGTMEAQRDPDSKETTSLQYLRCEVSSTWLTTTNRVGGKVRVPNVTRVSVWSWDLGLKVGSLRAVTCFLQSAWDYGEAVASHIKTGHFPLHFSHPQCSQTHSDVGTSQDLLQKGQKDGLGQIWSECHVG